MLNGSTIAEKIWNYLISKGINKFGAAGLMGNLCAESGLQPNNLEDYCELKLKENGKTYYTDVTYTSAIDSGKISRTEFMNPLPGKQYGYGLAQWTSPCRKAGLYDLVKQRNVSISDLETQLEYLWNELNSLYTSVLTVLKTATSVKAASDVVLKKFESPADTGTSIQNARAGYGQIYYNTFAASSNNSSNASIIQQVINDAVDFAVKMANDNTHGYSQVVRSLYNITNPTSFDCSSLVCTAFYYAFKKNGISPTPQDVGCSYTGNMLGNDGASGLLKCGFEIVATNQTGHSQMVKGDIELNITYHTALAIDADNIVHARSSEGTSDTIDNSGNEIRTQAWYVYSHGWTHRLRFTGKGLDLSSANGDGSVSIPTTSGSNPTSKNYLLKGDTGSAVKTMQTMLIKCGYSCGSAGADGDFGSGTYSALTKFQSENGLTVDGLYGNSSKAKLEAIYNTKTNSTTSSGEISQTVKWNGTVTASELNVRTWANGDKLCSFSPLSKSTVVGVCDSVKANNGSLWYFICYKGKYGFVHSDYIKK